MKSIGCRASRFICLLFACFVMSYNMMGQDVAVKTNLLSDGFLNINLGAEMMLSSKMEP